jgi:hypothetical protein
VLADTVDCCRKQLGSLPVRLCHHENGPISALPAAISSHCKSDQLRTGASDAPLNEEKRQSMTVLFIVGNVLLSGSPACLVIELSEPHVNEN